MSDLPEKNSLQSHGPLVITQEGRYETITCYGPMKIRASIAVDAMKVNGPLKISSSEVSMETLKVNGPTKASGNLTAGEIKINGPTVVEKSIQIKDWAKFNGPLTCSATVTLTETTTMKVNGPTKAERVIGGDEVILNGPVIVEEIHDVNSLKICGGIDGKSISARDVHISVRCGEGDFHLEKIEAVDVIIEKSNDEVPSFVGVGRKMASRFIKKFAHADCGNDSSLQHVDEIIASGKVSLAHARVNKVVARELELGENAEVQEFQQITD